MSAGTGGTSATIGRYIRYQKLDTKLMVVDPDHSVFLEYYQTGDASLKLDKGSRIEGIGRPRVEPSFIPGVVDDMRRIPDAASIATIHWLEKIIGRKTGPSTGTNLYGALQLASDMASRGETGSIVTLICDSGERYLDTCYDLSYVKDCVGDISQWQNNLKQFDQTGILH